MRRAVHERDGGRCTYRDRQGRRCTERYDLEYHHRFPFGLGADHNSAGITLLCRAHNQLMAERDFGTKKMEQHRRPRRGLRRSAELTSGPSCPKRAPPVG